MVPYRLPLLSMIRVARGFNPLVPLNEASVVIVPLPLASSNTVPSPRGASRRRCAVQVAAAVHDQAARGVAPLVPLNEASVVIVPLPWASSNTVPSASGASRRRCAVQVAAAVHDQRGIRSCPVGAVERGQRGDRAAALGQLEHRAVTRRRRPMSVVPYRLPLLSMISASHTVLPRWCR